MENSEAFRVRPDQMVRLINAKGPPPKLDHGPDHDAVFDPFELEGEEYFLHYMASIYCWMLRRPLALADRPLPVENSEERGDEAEVRNALAFMPPPAALTEPLPPPVDGIPRGIFQAPFWYRGKRFAWFVGEGSGGWQLAMFAQPEESHSDALEAA